jgi:hypothetical protein
VIFEKKTMQVKIESDGRDLFVVADGVRIAKRKQTQVAADRSMGTA